MAKVKSLLEGVVDMCYSSCFVMFVCLLLFL